MDAHSNRHEGPRPPLWHYGETEHDPIATKTLGFWLYMLSDALIFAGLFAAYGVLDQTMNTADGPVASQVVHPIAAFWQTLAVLSSVLAYSLATVAIRTNNRGGVMLGICVAIFFGVVFIGLEFADFVDLFAIGATPDRSGFLSAFFILVATHGLHMMFGILWMLVLLPQIVRFGLNTAVVTRLLNLRLFWQFQASVWVCVYIFVYLRGTIQ
jgi:cytochrome o ubiquinol oxidase subunit 3